MTEKYTLDENKVRNLMDANDMSFDDLTEKLADALLVVVCEIENVDNYHALVAKVGEDAAGDLTMKSIESSTVRNWASGRKPVVSAHIMLSFIKVFDLNSFDDILVEPKKKAFENPRTPEVAKFLKLTSFRYFIEFFRFLQSAADEFIPYAKYLHFTETRDFPNRFRRFYAPECTSKFESFYFSEVELIPHKWPSDTTYEFAYYMFGWRIDFGTVRVLPTGEVHLKHYFNNTKTTVRLPDDAQGRVRVWNWVNDQRIHRVEFSVSSRNRFSIRADNVLDPLFDDKDNKRDPLRLPTGTISFEKAPHHKED